MHMNEQTSYLRLIGWILIGFSEDFFFRKLHKDRDILSLTRCSFSQRHATKLFYVSADDIKHQPIKLIQSAIPDLGVTKS